MFLAAVGVWLFPFNVQAHPSMCMVVPSLFRCTRNCTVLLLLPPLFVFARGSLRA